MITMIMCYEINVGDKIADMFDSNPLEVIDVDLHFHQCQVEVQLGNGGVRFFDFYYEVEKHEPDQMYTTNYADLIERLEF